MRRNVVVSRDDLTGRVVGLVVFLAGVLLLIFVAVMAYFYFTSSTTGLPLTPSGGGGEAAPATTRLGESAVRILVQIGMLIVMAIVGSLLASRGLQLYYSSRGSSPTSHETRSGEE